MSYYAEKRYINPSSGRIKTNVLSQDADSLPLRHRGIKSFKESFGGVNHYTCTIEGCFIVVPVKYAFDHFKKNTYSENREHLNGTLLATLNDPLLIIKSSYEDQNTLTFYKPFKSDSGLEHMVMFKAHKEEDGKYYFKTIYRQESLHKIDEIIRATDGNTVYFKYM